MFDTSSAIKTLVNKVFYRADSTSFELIRFVLDKYGYPTYKKLGFPTSDLHVLIMHTTTYDNAWSNYILNKLEQLNATCDYPEKSQLLFLIDRQRIRQGKKSLAGLSGGSRRYFTIEDIKKVDSIRFSYNLLRLKDENYPGDSLPDNYQPQPYPANYFCGKKYRID
jgi:hypothetical protein